MNKVLVSIIILFLIGSCDHSQQQSSVSKTTQINPNGDSELALLMRNMHGDIAKLKDQFEGGNKKVPLAFVKLLEEMEAAEATKPEVKTEAFTAYAKIISEKAKQLASKNDIEQSDYNELIDMCISCHQSFCPGPIKTIKKLKISKSSN